ncbi:MAG: hypothetical protein EPO02_12745 [Nitrospirae bacterium]|jgi:hypothetical protein|nr:MAG: hypothetical protein EPO02_12745 [Nitrospirota bacterium]
MSTKLNFARDVQGYNAFAPPVSTNMFSATLAAGGNASITLPVNALSWIVAFSYQPGSDIWVRFNGTAAAPAGATFAATTSELNPGVRVVSAFKADGTTAATINILNNGAASADVWVGLYANT